MRTRLPDRRMAVTREVHHKNADGNSIKFLITFGIDAENSIKEVFCADPRIGSDIHALLTDGCILISIALQRGEEPEHIVISLGENRQEGEKKGPPSSVFGAIARTLLEYQQELHAP